MTTTITRPPRQHRLDDIDLRTRAASPPEQTRRRPVAAALAGLRITTGFVFLWAFVDKLVGLGYSTPAERAWLNGGSPTKGFLGSLEAGPLASTFRAIAGDSWVDSLFMLGLLGIGTGLVLGVAMRLTAASGTLLMVMMWLAEWHPARWTSSGTPTGSTNPLVDYHVVYALVLIVLAVAAAGDSFGLGRLWRSVPFVGRHEGLLS